MKLFLTKTLSALLLFVVLLNSGCATIFGHSKYAVTINSNPPASTITITDRKGVEVFKGVTPATVTLRSSAGYFSRGIYQVKFHLTGYEDRTVSIEGSLNGWYIGNILIGGVIGMLIIDPASGAMYKIEDKEINQTLQSSTHAQASLDILDIKSLSAETQKKLVKIN
ncbi:hypothetical protein BDD43_1872 [Mucilaginibacter gracilis]|uniref:PEGA domain-containing protein n=1 Tax=Mucilaginibacter gracilis TaxID=423350 RepID=A0A495IYS7_9SPHI|nr:hypothetical protein [Mucilaginibacter gracilis]RKR81722.1 hypothetical protein BDD43_1872 [Mucilaginibacter gracilis]